jgi:PAS domain S-box-containing protein
MPALGEGNKVMQAGEIDVSLAALIQFSPVASCVTNPRLHDNPIIACNRPSTALTGYTEAEVVGRNCRFLAGPDTEVWLSDKIVAAVAARKPVLVEILNYRKNGEAFRNAVLVAPTFDDGGKLEFFLGSQVELDMDAPGPGSRRRREATRLVQTLSRRQRDVLVEMANGMLNKQIAFTLGLSEKTVKMHRALLIQKLGVPTSADAVRIAVEAGF